MRHDVDDARLVLMRLVDDHGHAGAKQAWKVIVNYIQALERSDYQLQQQAGQAASLLRTYERVRREIDEPLADRLRSEAAENIEDLKRSIAGAEVKIASGEYPLVRRGGKIRRETEGEVRSDIARWQDEIARLEAIVADMAE